MYMVYIDIVAKPLILEKKTSLIRVGKQLRMKETSKEQMECLQMEYSLPNIRISKA